MSKRIKLERVEVRSVRLLGQGTPDIITLKVDPEDGDDTAEFDIATYRLKAADIAALREAAISEKFLMATITIEVETE